MCVCELQLLNSWASLAVVVLSVLFTEDHISGGMSRPNIFVATVRFLVNSGQQQAMVRRLNCFRTVYKLFEVCQTCG